MKERVGGRQRSLSFLPVFSCLEIPLIAGKAPALCSGGSRRGARGTRDPSPPSYFEPKPRPEGPKKKNVLRPGSPVSLGLDDPPPPLPFIWRSASATALSEQIPSAFSLPLHWPKHSICSIDKCTFCLCYTYNTSLSLIFFYQTGTDLSSSQSRFVSFFRSVFNLVA